MSNPPWDQMNEVSGKFGAEGCELIPADGIGDGNVLLCLKRPKL